MGKTCCVYACNSNYNSERKTHDKEIRVFRFPKDSDERQRWIAVISKINANLRVTDNTVVCSLHWPEKFETKELHG